MRPPRVDSSQVLVREEGKSFASFLTQMCGIIGGVFTVTGLVDAGVFHTSASLRKKMEIGKAI
jgi:hypothetical protein